MVTETKGTTPAKRKKRNAAQLGTLLLVEDDPDAIEQLSFRLKREGYALNVAKNARRAMYLSAQSRYDVIIMDYFLPDGDGEQICKELREEGVDTPILMLTARRGLGSKVSAFDQGADDYLTKPFAFEELFARLRALQRRGRSRNIDRLTVGNVSLDRESRTAVLEDRVIQLSPLEFNLLAYLMKHPNRALTRREIVDEVWSAGKEASTKSVDVYIRYLRKKIWGGKSASPIRTLKGTGYHFED
ncbi:MAG: response regulator transcription factor [Alphaproteobacteria bacterium]|nr:response regulator transcription factor [Alphaproteobacteria bacterium]MCZ6764353.1 response regulator transcription factor [Alphaproteobacteria bacterium]